jgi:hypothetical protein
VRAFDHNRQVRLLAELVRELALRGVSAALSDARPAVFLRTGLVIPWLSVTVDNAGEFFEWRNGYNRHSVKDPAGAAAALLAYINARTTNRSHDLRPVPGAGAPDSGSGVLVRCPYAVLVGAGPVPDRMASGRGDRSG